MPSHKYAPGIEIRRYLELVVERHGLTDKVLFRSHVDRLQWDEAARRWRVEIRTARPGTEGREFNIIRVQTQFAHLTNGVLMQPQIPRLGSGSGEGLAAFAGPMLHTARWDYAVTGGTPDEAFPALDGLRGKRVGLIGTGATAIQVLPQLARYAKEVYVFQRTPCAVFPRNQRATDPAEWEAKIAARPGWQRERLRNFAAAISRGALREDGDDADFVDLVDDWFSKQSAYAALTGEPDYQNPRPEDVPAMIGRFLALDEPVRAKLRVSSFGVTVYPLYRASGAHFFVERGFQFLKRVGEL